MDSSEINANSLRDLNAKYLKHTLEEERELLDSDQYKQLLHELIMAASEGHTGKSFFSESIHWALVHKEEIRKDLRKRGLIVKVEYPGVNISWKKESIPRSEVTR